MNRANAVKIATGLVDQLNRYCDWIGIAGSVRRGTPEVKDIEIVAVPRWEDRTLEGLLFDFPNTVNLLYEYCQDIPPHHTNIEWIKPGTSVIEPWPIKPDGKYWRGLIGVANGAGPVTRIKLDLFIARRENLGVIYTIRTGSADFSRELVTYARDRTDYRVEGGELKYKGAIVPCPDEETLFQALNLRWITPDARGGKQDLIILN